MAAVSVETKGASASTSGGAYNSKEFNDAIDRCLAVNKITLPPEMIPVVRLLITDVANKIDDTYRVRMEDTMRGEMAKITAKISELKVSEATLSRHRESLNALVKQLDLEVASLKTKNDDLVRMLGLARAENEKLAAAAIVAALPRPAPRPPAAAAAAAAASAAAPTVVVPKETKAVSIHASLYGIHGHCLKCEKYVPVKVGRRCAHWKCLSTKIAEAKDGEVWTDLYKQYSGCVHLEPTACTSTRWEFFGICPDHPDQKDAPLLLCQIICNDTKETCVGCGKVEPTLLQFGCGHFICAMKCWRNYVRTKLDNRELLFDTPTPGCDSTLACPAGCRHFIQSHALFKALGKARHEQYQTLGMEHLVGRSLTKESDEGRLALVKRLPLQNNYKFCVNCGSQHSRVKDGAHEVNLNCKIKCHRCGFLWCWTCELDWTPACKAHIISWK
ncbi:MAG: hypothetical protein Harvfovirus17_15 [Harvfovirus sp.]|uniref:RING/Ubox-like zinc-binding domain-containing protein n=1 Tax=Harvfovirus sp. TaxID=2487768 RepID=A0A3G5A4I3_9VIRU|nr:MAG: hypothetical protein Harvfovirus17_15 [Harvfovirus sp.]